MKMAVVPIQSNSDDNMDHQRHDYHHHEHHHHHYYHHHHDHDYDDQNHHYSTKHNHHHHQNHPKPTYQVYCRADYNYALTIRDGSVILAPSNPSDPHQHWYKEERFKTLAKDEIGLPSFALVNKASGQAIKHSVAPAQPVQLTDHQYDPDQAGLDLSILFSEASIVEDVHYKAIRAVNNIGLNMDASHAVKEFGGVKDGNIIILWEWNGGDNQRWIMLPY